MKKKNKAKKNKTKYLVLIGIFILIAVLVRRETLREQPINMASQIKLSLTLPGGIKIGDSSIENVKLALGEPVFQQNDSYFYVSESISRNHEAKFSDGRLSFFREIITDKDSLTIKEINNIYGLPERVLYGEISTGGYNLFAYPSKGIAYIGNEIAEIPLEVWHFAPTTHEDFKSKFAKDYAETEEGVRVY